MIGPSWLANPLGPPRSTLGGTYRIGLRLVGGAWTVEAMAMTAQWADGNKDVNPVSGVQHPTAA